MARSSEYVSYGLIAAAVGLTVVAVVDRDRPTTKEQASRAGPFSIERFSQLSAPHGIKVLTAPNDSRAQEGRTANCD